MILARARQGSPALAFATTETRNLSRPASDPALNGADLIAMATHGLSGLARVSYGSVAAGVLQAADIPILLIRSGSDKKEETC